MKPIRFLLICGVAAGLSAPVFAKNDNHDKDEHEKKIALADAPAAVQQTINSHLAGGTLESVEVETKKSGDIYEADVKMPDGSELELKVAADGTLLKTKTEHEGKDAKKDKDQD